MEPRELWNRHTVLAEAFCRCDEEVRSAQTVLDEAQAHRSRTLAAFATTLGSDRAVADLLGLTERETRVARRTVGKDAALAVAEELLTSAVPPAQEQPADTAGPAGPPHRETSQWNPAADAMLAEAWHAGADLWALAEGLGVDLRQLVARAQQLSVRGELHQLEKAASHEGKHRREHVVLTTPHPSAVPAHMSTAEPAPAYVWAGRDNERVAPYPSGLDLPQPPSAPSGDTYAPDYAPAYAEAW